MPPCGETAPGGRPVHADPAAGSRRTTRSAPTAENGHYPFGVSGDEDLISLVEGGDTLAFSVLYDRHVRAACSLAYGMVGKRQDAEDLVQDAFLRVWLAAGTYRAERGSVRTWVLSIVQNRGIDALRAAASRRAREGGEATAPRFQPCEAFGEAWGNSRRARVREALMKLPPEQLKILELAYFSDHTHVEIAELLGLPLGTVKGRVRLAREKLKAHFGASRASGGLV